VFSTVAVASHDAVAVAHEASFFVITEGAAQSKTPAGLWPAGVCDERNEVLKSIHRLEIEL
jgi:hypothetical protein